MKRRLRNQFTMCRRGHAPMGTCIHVPSGYAPLNMYSYTNGPFLYVVFLTVINLYLLLVLFCVFSICVFSIYVMFLLYVYTFTIRSCHVALKVYLLTYLLTYLLITHLVTHLVWPHQQDTLAREA